MARRKWRGVVDLNLPQGTRHALMTICPGQEAQTGTRFKTIMQEASDKLDSLTIVNAAGLSFHNFKNILPGDIADEGAKELANLRSKNWMLANEDAVKDTMGARCTIISMDEIVNDPTFQERSNLIQEIYARGDNPVTEWFDYSLRLDTETRSPRLQGKGIFIQDDSIRKSGLAYLCDEYAMRSLMTERWGLDEIYLGLAVRDSGLFQRHNTTRSDIDLSIPPNHEIVLTETVPIHDKKLGHAVVPFPASQLA